MFVLSTFYTLSSLTAIADSFELLRSIQKCLASRVWRDGRLLSFPRPAFVRVRTAVKRCKARIEATIWAVAFRVIRWLGEPRMDIHHSFLFLLSLLQSVFLVLCQFYGAFLPLLVLSLLEVSPFARGLSCVADGASHTTLRAFVCRGGPEQLVGGFDWIVGLDRWAGELVAFLNDLIPVRVLAHLYMPLRGSLLHNVLLNAVRLHANVAIRVDQALMAPFLVHIVEVELSDFFDS